LLYHFARVAQTAAPAMAVDDRALVPRDQRRFIETVPAALRAASTQNLAGAAAAGRGARSLRGRRI